MSDSCGDHHDQIPRWVALDRNNSTLGRQLPQRQMRNFQQRQDADQSRYYSEDSELDSTSVTSVSASEASTIREGQNLEPEGTFDCHLNQKITFSTLNDDSSTNDLWIWLADAYQCIDSGCLLSALKNKIDKSLSNGFWGVWFRPVHVGGHHNILLIGMFSSRKEIM